MAVPQPKARRIRTVRYEAENVGARPGVAMVAADHRLYLPRLPGVAVPSRALLTAYSPTLLSQEPRPGLHWVVPVLRS
ncbi:hypothetical protein GCM10020295_36370 [Streptomyces cinereospinus]